MLWGRDDRMASATPDGDTIHMVDATEQALATALAERDEARQQRDEIAMQAQRAYNAARRSVMEELDGVLHLERDMVRWQEFLPTWEHRQLPLLACAAEGFQPRCQGQSLSGAASEEMWRPCARGRRSTWTQGVVWRHH